MSNINRADISNSSLDQTDFIKKKDGSRPLEPGQPAASGADSIVLSGKAKAIDRLAGLVHQSRLEQLAELREALGSGTYSVSGTDIARKMIDSNWK